MAVTMHPIDASAGAPAYSAQQTRQALSVLHAYPTATRPLGARSGVRAGTPSTTVFLSGGGSTTWNVAAHSGVLDTESPVAAGPYQYASDGADTGTITAANATNPRVDSIFIQVNDTVQDGSGLRNGAISYVAGVAGTAGGARGAAGGPPNIPARAIELAQINVPISGGGAPTVTWLAPYTTASGGIIPARSSTDYPASPYEGLYADDATSNTLMRYSGAAWVPANPPSVAQLGAVPGVNTDSSQSAGVQTWLLLGSVTVPSWATQAVVSFTVGGIISPVAQGNTKAAIQIGAVNGSLQRMLEPGVSARFYHTFHDVLSGISTGSQSIRLVSQFIATGVYRLDVNSSVTAAFTFLP